MVAVEGRLHHPALLAVEVPVGRDDAVAEHRAQPLEDPAAPELLCLLDQDRVDVVGAREYVDGPGADVQAHDVAVLAQRFEERDRPPPQGEGVAQER